VKTLSPGTAFGIIGAFIALWPVASFLIASALAYVLSCEISMSTIDYAGRVGSCILFGQNIGPTLNAMETSSLLIFLTLPVGLVIGILGQLKRSSKN
jgi:hypothetical protein